MSTFNDQYKSPHVEPAFGNDGLTDFPFDEVCRSVDGEEQATTERDYADAMRIMQSFFDWILRENLNDSNSIRRVGMRTIAAAWVIDPSRFGNDRQTQSLDGLARRFGFSNANLSPLTADFSSAFGIRNQFQSHDSNSKSLQHEKTDDHSNN